MVAITKTLVLSLPEDVARREHIASHFLDQGLSDHEFFPAVPHTADVVRNAYREGAVKGYPPCFRCGQATCSCDNNILIPQQVANFLSFAALWEHVAASSDGYYLLCEDDVAFHGNAVMLLKRFLGRYAPSKRKVLLRLSHSGQEPFRSLDPATDLSLVETVAMSNPAYLLNREMALFLWRSLATVETTSDVWVHERMSRCEDVEAFTVHPLLATDLSFNKRFARFRSRIHPKGIDGSDRERQGAHVKRVSIEGQYGNLLSRWLDAP